MAWRVALGALLCIFGACNALDCLGNKGTRKDVDALFALAFGLGGVVLFVAGVKHRPAIAPPPGGSLGRCPDCGGPVSLHAPACPHCGRPR